MWTALIAVATLPIALFPAREVSGTSWAPDSGAAYGVHRHAGAWDLMLHGNAFVQFIYEPPANVHRTGGPQTTQTTSVNWGMLMARRRIGEGRFGIDVMLSLEPWTVPVCGTLNYFQTGEMCGGDTIHDRQHPHDLFMELAAQYDRPLGSGARWQIYGGVSGEPALGPPAFPHRLSALDNPIAPITHHWLDSTHISLASSPAPSSQKMEGRRIGLQRPRTRRRSKKYRPRTARFRVRARDLAADAAARATGFRPAISPTPSSNSRRIHARVTRGSPPRRSTSARSVPAGGHRPWPTASTVHTCSCLVCSTTFRYSSAVLAETTLMMNERHSVFGRFELAGKLAHDLHLDTDPLAVLPVAKLQAGYVWHFKMGPSSVGIGVSPSVSRVPPALSPGITAATRRGWTSSWSSGRRGT